MSDIKQNRQLSETQTLVEQLEVAIAVAELDSHVIVEYNDKFFERCIKSQDQNNDLSIPNILPTLNLKMLQKVLGRNRKYRHHEVLCCQGVDRPVDFVFSVIQLSDKPHILIQGTDNSASLEVKSMVASYDQLFKAQTLAITQEKEKSQIASKVKSQFLSRMSHELRTPMNAVLGFAQLQELKLTDLPELNENNACILKAGFQLLSLIDKMFEYAEVEDHKLNINIEDCDVNQCIKAALSHCTELVEKHQVEVSYQSTSLYVKADRLRLIEIIEELISNGIKFNNPHGLVKVRVVNTTDDDVEIFIEDNGTSLTTKEQKHLFEPFFRSAHAERQEIPGVGIGLVLSQKVASLMNGRIDCKTNQPAGDGMTFCLHLKQSQP